MKKIEGLEQDRSRGDRYLNLINNVGWKLLEQDLIDEWMNCLTLLKKTDDPVAIKMRAIEDIFNKVNSEIKFGEVAKERLSKWNSGKN